MASASIASPAFRMLAASLRAQKAISASSSPSSSSCSSNLAAGRTFSQRQFSSLISTSRQAVRTNAQSSRPKRPFSSSSASHNSTSARPADLSKPFLFFEGPAFYSSFHTMGSVIAFVFIGITTGFNLNRNLAWPIWSRDPKDQVSTRNKTIVSAVVGALCVSFAAIFKLGAVRNITAIKVMEKDGQRLAIIQTASASWLPRGRINSSLGKHIIAGKMGPEFVVPLSLVLRGSGSARASSWIDGRTEGRSRKTASHLHMSIAGDTYTINSVGFPPPQPTEGQNIFGRVKQWVMTPGAATEKRYRPWFWSPAAFDEVFPQIAVTT